MRATHEPRLQARLGPGDVVAQDHEQATVRLDESGRWISLHLPGLPYHRTMDGQVVQRTSAGAVTLSTTAAASVHLQVARIALQIADLTDELPPDERRVRGGTPAQLVARLRRVRDWSVERLVAEADRFAAAYPEPVPILPPDRYRDVVLQPATGCPSGACTFCAFYRGHRFQPLSPAAFEAHLAAVRDLFGPALALRDGAFLGSASAASLPQPMLLAVLGRLTGVLGPLRRGVATFLDPDHAPARDSAAWARLGEVGLRHVVVGLETGHGPLRAQLGKAGELAPLHRAAEELRAAGLSVGVTVLVGAGGRGAMEAHHAGTCLAIERMGLGPRDLVYLSPLVDSLPPPALRAALDTLRTRLRSLTAAKVSPYRMDLFHYYA